MKLSYQKFWLILWCWTNQIPVKQSMNLCSLSEETIRRWFGRFRANLPENKAILERVVQLDEAYFKEVSLMMAKQKGSRKLAFEIIPSNRIQRHHANKFLQEHVKPRSQLRTDGAGIYIGIHRWWPVRHQRDIHSKWEFELTSEIEGMFGNLRTFIRRMYHHVTSKYLPEYVSEFCLRFSSPEIFDSPLTYLQKTLTLVPFD